MKLLRLILPALLCLPMLGTICYAQQSGSAQSPKAKPGSPPAAKAPSAKPAPAPTTPAAQPAGAVPNQPTPSTPRPTPVGVMQPASAPSGIPISTSPAKRPDPAETQVSMSFDKADVNSVVKFISMASGTPIVCDPDLKGNVTIISLKQIPLQDAYEVVNAALRVRGYTMVGGLDSRVIRVISLKKATADGVQVRSGKEPDKTLTGDSMVTQVIPLEFASAARMKDDLKPMVSDDQATITAIASTNTLIVTDNASNIHRIAQVVRELDKDTSDVMEVQIYHCKCATADSLVDTLTKVFQLQKSPGAGGQPGGPQPGQPGGPPAVRTDDGLISMKGELRVASDARTNSLIISASKERAALVMDVLKRLDVDTEAEVRAKVFTLQSADAKYVADQLNKLFEQPQGGSGGGTNRRYYPWDNPSSGAQTSTYAGLKRNVVIADVRTNSVIVTATEQNMRAFEQMIKELDKEKVLSDITRVFPLQYAKAADLADTLNRLFRGETRRNNSYYDFMMFDYGMGNNNQGGPLDDLKNITVVAEEKTNQLLVTAPPNAFASIGEMIEKLDKRTAQVFIEVAIVDVTLDSDFKFGVEWSWTSSELAADGRPKESAVTDFGLTKETTGFKYTILENNVKALLHMLRTKSNVKVLSTPTIMTADNVEGRISIGQDEPYISSEEDTTNGNFRRTVDFKKVAVALTVTPHVNSVSKFLSLDIHQTINEVVAREPVLNAPIVADREAQTTVSVEDGKTIVIGGIIKNNHDRVTKSVPILSQIPIIGELFKSRDWQTTRSELMVFLTPHIVKTTADSSAITDRVRDNLSEKPMISDPLPTVGTVDKP